MGDRPIIPPKPPPVDAMAPGHGNSDIIHLNRTFIDAVPLPVYYPVRLDPELTNGRSPHNPAEGQATTGVRTSPSRPLRCKGG